MARQQWRAGCDARHRILARDRTTTMGDLNRTGLYDLHVELGAKMVPFAGWEMPVQYPMGVMKEHLHCRSAAGLFDVGHMGQVILRGDSAARALETLVPMDIEGLGEGRQRYAFFTNEAGGILDDLMVANRGDHLFVVVNAAPADHDLAHMKAHLPGIEVTRIADRGLLALQGPGAEAALEAVAPGVRTMRFMDVRTVDGDFGPLWISRSGYTGEDGFEISVEARHTEALARALLNQEGVAPIGLGARDSLRLEAGLCLYGSDIDETTSPVEAGLTWAIQKARRAGGARAGGFPGAELILGELEAGPSRVRVGIRPEGRAPMRAGTQMFAEDGTSIGTVTSGAYGPTIEAPMSMAYLDAPHTTPGTQVLGDVRGKKMPAVVSDLPFRPATFKR